MKRIFASLLAVVMLVACFAVTSSAYTVDMTMTNTEVKTGEIVTLTWTYKFTPDTSDVDAPIIMWVYDYDPAQLEYIGFSTPNTWEITDLSDAAEHYVYLGVFEADNGVAGTELTYTINVQFKVLAAAGTEITLTDAPEVSGALTVVCNSDGDFYASDYNLATYTMKVAADEPAVVIGEAASKGAQIRAEKYDDVSDIRFAFTADETSAVIASVEYKITCNGKEITVDGKTASHDGLFKVVVENVPADYYDADFAVDFVVTYADGTVKTASDINNINAVAAA